MTAMDEEEHRVLSNRPKQFLGNKWGGETFHDILVREKRSTLSGGETEVGESHCGGQSERDCEPAETSGDETPHSLEGLCSNRRLPVSLVTEDSSKVSNEVDNSENKATRAEESEVGAAMVADRRVRRLPTGHKLEDGFRRSEGIGHVLERVEEDLNHEQDDEEEDESGVEVGDVEGGAEPPDQCVPSDHHGKQHRGQLRAQVSHQAVEDRGSSNGEGHHDDQVCEEGKGAEDQVGPCSEPSFNHLEEGLCTRCPGLQHDGEDGENDDLDGGSPCVPVGPADTVLACNR